MAGKGAEALNNTSSTENAGIVVRWIFRLDADGEGKIRDDELGDSAPVIVYQSDVAGQTPLGVGERVRYRLERDLHSNLYLARDVRID